MEENEIKISEFTQTTTISNTDLIPIVQGNETKSITKENLLAEVGDLTELETTDKTSIVSAVNEMAPRGDKYEYIAPRVTTNLPSGSWQYLATDMLTDIIPAGRYLVEFSSSVAGASNNVVEICTIQGGIDGNFSNSQRLSVPIKVNSFSGFEAWRIADFTTSVAHTINAQGYGTASFYIPFDLVVTFYRLK